MGRIKYEEEESREMISDPLEISTYSYKTFLVLKAD